MAKERMSITIDAEVLQAARVAAARSGMRLGEYVESVLRGYFETLEVLADPKLVSEIRRAQRDVDAGRTQRLSREEAEALVRNGDD